MNRRILWGRHLVEVSFLLGVISVWPTVGAAQTVAGDGSAVQATVFGPVGSTTTTLADTGTLSTINNARDASLDTGSVPGLLTAEVLSAGTISWPDEVDSYASLGNLNLSVAGVPIYADSVVARASSVLGGVGSGTSYLSNLSINGSQIYVSGVPNQTIWIPGGQVVINEQTLSPTGSTVVNALHVTVTGVADVVVASATAGIH